MCVISIIFIVICFALSDVALSSNSNITDSSDTSMWDCRQPPAGFNIAYGYTASFKSTYRPYYFTSTRNVTLFSTFRHCELYHEALENDKQVHYEIHEASPTTLYLLLKEDTKKFLSVDMRTCVVKDLSEKILSKRDSDWRQIGNLIYFDDGFDEIIVENNATFRVSYDLDGNRIGQPRPFLLKQRPANMRPISSKSRTSNLVADYPSITSGDIDLLDADGRIIKKLFNSTNGVRYIADVDDSLFAYCYKNFWNANFECVQFDEFGNEVYRNSTARIGYFLGMKSLKKGDLVLVTKSDENNLHVIEMQPGKISQITYPIKYRSIELFVTDFDRANRQFTVHVEIWKQEKICRHNFSLPGEPELNHS